MGTTRDRLLDAELPSSEGLDPSKAWYIPLELDGVRLAVCCGHQGGDAGEFVLFTDPSRPTVRRGFRKVDVTPQLTALTDALAEILTADPDIHDVVWIDV
jgi:hypothetical protein